MKNKHTKTFEVKSVFQMLFLEFALNILTLMMIVDTMLFCFI